MRMFTPAETHLLFLYTLTDDPAGAAKTFRQIIEGGFLLAGENEVKLHFPDGKETVKKYVDGEGTHIEFGTLSMQKIVRSILSGESRVMEIYHFRFHFVLGNFYYSLGFPKIALDHYSTGLKSVSFLKEYVTPFADRTYVSPLFFEKPIKEILSAADFQKYLSMLNTARALLTEKIRESKEKNDMPAEIWYLNVYLKIFSDKDRTDRLLRLYKKQRSFKDFRLLKLSIEQNYSSE